MEKTSADGFERVNRNASVPVSAVEMYFNYLRYILPFKHFWFKSAYLHNVSTKNKACPSPYKLDLASVSLKVPE